MPVMHIHLTEEEAEEQGVEAGSMDMVEEEEEDEDEDEDVIDQPHIQQW